MSETARDQSPLRVRKRLLDAAARASPADEIDIARCATVWFSSEQPNHPVEHLFDGRAGPGASRWIGGCADETEEIVVEFDRPQPVSRLV